MRLYFATGNEGKIEEMKPIFEERGHKIVQQDPDVPEIDSMDIEEVAERKVLDSYKEVQKSPLIVEDTGLFIECLNGFPGVEAAHFARTAGTDKLLKLLENEESRSAYFKTAIALLIDGGVEIFTGKMTGEIPREKRGESHPHLPYNSYFLPDHGDGESLAENEDLKNEEMHRRKALKKLLDWLDE